MAYRRVVIRQNLTDVTGGSNANGDWNEIGASPEYKHGPAA
ncbi:hypothetical protein [Kordiimonas gwangyangensis]|nr:hypothetical protein [Kordiimonas gwangyangensis]